MHSPLFGGALSLTVFGWATMPLLFDSQTVVFSGRGVIYISSGKKSMTVSSGSAFFERMHFSKNGAK